MTTYNYFSTTHSLVLSNYNFFDLGHLAKKKEKEQSFEWKIRLKEIEKSKNGVNTI